MTTVGQAAPAPASAQGLATLLLGALWLMALLRLASDAPVLVVTSAAALAVFCVIALTTATWTSRALCAALLAAAAALALHEGEARTLWVGLERSVLFAAFLPTLALVRGVAEGDPLILAYRARAEAAGGAARPLWTLAGAYAMASFLSVGASAVSAAALRRDASMRERERDARASVCAAAQALRWSPFFVALAVTTEFVPDADLPVVMLFGFALGALGVAAAARVLAPGVPTSALGGPLRAVGALAGPIAFTTLALVLVREAAAVSTLEAMLLTLPALCLARAALRGGTALRATIGAGGRALGRIREEIALVAAALILGTVLSDGGALEAVAPLARLQEAWPPLLVAGTIAGMAAAATLGLHPLVCGMVALAALTAAPTPLSPTATALTVLAGWSAGSMLSMASLMVLSAASQYGVPPARVAYGRNLLFFAGFLPVEAAAIVAVNAVT